MARRELKRSREFDDLYIDNDEGKYVKQSRVSSFTNKEGEMLFRASTPEEKFKYETEKRLNIKKKIDQKIGDKAKADNPYEIKNLDLNKAALQERKEKLADEAAAQKRKEKFDALKKERDKVKALPQAPVEESELSKVSGGGRKKRTRKYKRKRKETRKHISRATRKYKHKRSSK